MQCGNFRWISVPFRKFCSADGVCAVCVSACIMHSNLSNILSYAFAYNIYVGWCIWRCMVQTKPQKPCAASQPPRKTDVPGVLLLLCVLCVHCANTKPGPPAQITKFTQYLTPISGRYNANIHAIAPKVHFAPWLLLLLLYAVRWNIHRADQCTLEGSTLFAVCWWKLLHKL